MCDSVNSICETWEASQQCVNRRADGATFQSYSSERHILLQTNACGDNEALIGNRCATHISSAASVDLQPNHRFENIRTSFLRACEALDDVVQRELVSDQRFQVH